MESSPSGIRAEYASQYRDRISHGEVKNGIRALAIMARECDKAGGQVLNLTIGDIDWRSMKTDYPELVDRLGLDPNGSFRESIDKYVMNLRRQFADPVNDSIWSYQPEAVGLPALRAEFATFINSFGFDYKTEETVLSAGSLPGLDSLLGIIQFKAKQENKQAQLVFPNPAFSVVKAQAIRRGFTVYDLKTSSENGFCPAAADLTKLLSEANDDRALLYLTPVNNPTSTTYDPEKFKSVMVEFHRLRPQGKIILDLAYVEMIPERKLGQLLACTSDQSLIGNIVVTTSMSKLFGEPRLRMAALYTRDAEILKELKTHWQTVFASISGPAELEALARFRMVPKEVRQELYAVLRQRQDKVLDIFRLLNAERQHRGKPDLIDMTRIYREIPMYIYAGLEDGDTLDLFTETGILGVPGEVFGDSAENRMVRIAVGMKDLSSHMIQFLPFYNY